MKYQLSIYCLLLILSGCAKSLQGDSYTRDDARRAMTFQWATVQSVKPVVIEGDRSEKGMIAGGLIGGMAGHGVTSSKTQGLVTAVGAVAGAMAGQMAEEKMTRAQGLELMLSLENGNNIVVVQEVGNVDEFSVGDRVKVVVDKGVTRVSK